MPESTDKMVSISLRDLKLIRTIAKDVYHDLVDSNRPSHDEWCASPINLNKIISIVDKVKVD